MNQVQQAIARVVGLDDVIESQNGRLAEVENAYEHLYTDNQMLQRTIEDLDYLNLYDIGQLVEVLPGADRKKTIIRLRRLRHDNPLAKQAVKLIVRFALGKGVQWVLAADDDATQSAPETPEPGLGPDPTPPVPTGKIGHPNRLPVPTRFVQLPRSARAQEQELLDPAVDPEEDPTETPAKPGSRLPVVPELEEDPIREIIEAFWQDDENRLVLTSHRAMQEMLDDVVTDGEKFYACFTEQAEPYLRVTEIPLEEIDGIVYNPDNRVQPVLYRRMFRKLKYDGQNDQYVPDGDPQVKYYLDYRITDEQWTKLKKTIKVPAAKLNVDAKIRHVYINPLWTKSGKRGISELYASREWFRVFREFMEGRAAINQAAQSISYKRKIKGGPTAVAQFSGTFGGRSMGNDAGTDLQKLTRPVPGATYDHNEAVDLEWMKTDTGAAGAAQDAKMLLMSAGSGVGMMTHYFGEGGDANLATAQSMELPMVKTYEDWQQWVDEEYREWIRYSLTVALNDPDLVKDAIERLGFTFPPIISQDVVKYTTSWAQIVRDIAPNNMTVKREAIRGALSIMGVANIDGIMPEVEAQMAHAEQLRIQQQQNMAASLANPLAPNGPQPGVTPPQLKPFADNAKTKIPTLGMNPNLQHMAAGKGEKASNGPKPE